MVMCRIEREVGTPTGQRDISKSSWNGLDADGFKKHNPGSLNAKNSLACPIYNRNHKTHEPCRNTKFRSVADLRRHVHGAHIRQPASIERQMEVPGGMEENIPKLRDRELELVLEKCAVRGLTTQFDNVKILAPPSSLPVAEIASPTMLQIASAQKASSPGSGRHGLSKLSWIIESWCTKVRFALGYVLGNLSSPRHPFSSSLSFIPNLAPSVPDPRPELNGGDARGMQRNPHSKSHRGSSGLPAASKREAKRTSTLQPQRKRTRASSNDDFDDDNDYNSDDDDAPVGGLRGERAEAGTQAFACPYFRMSPIRHMDCVNRKLTRVRDVKQHIQRRHSQVTFPCPICCESFPSALHRDDHIRARRCEPPAHPRTNSPGNIPPDAQERLKVRAKRTLSPVEQWYAVWDILFTKETRPDNPYLGTILEETVRMMRVFSRQEAPQIVPAFLQSKQIRAGTVDGGLESLLMDLLDEVQARFEQRTREPSNTGSPGNGSGRLQTFAPTNNEPQPSSETLAPLAPQPTHGSCISLDPYACNYGTATPQIGTWHPLSNTMSSLNDDVGWDQLQPAESPNPEDAIPIPFQYEDLGFPTTIFEGFGLLECNQYLGSVDQHTCQ